MNQFKETYLKDPCKTLSIPYWKYCSFSIPKDIDIFHEEDQNRNSFLSNHIQKYKTVERFFRMSHSLKHITDFSDEEITIVAEDELEKLAEMINIAYQEQGIGVSKAILEEARLRKVCHDSLWICIKKEGKMIASGIAEFDEECKEGILEWIQVLPDYQRKGYGEKIVLELLRRIKRLDAKFVSVSGSLDNLSQPIKLYRRVGFEGNDIWYICRKIKYETESNV